MASHRENQHSTNLHRQKWRDETGEDRPDHQSVPLPLPKEMNKLQRVAMAEVQDIGSRHRQPARSEQNNATMDKGQEKQPLERSHQMDANLRRHVVESEDPSEQEHGNGSQAEKRIDTHHQGDRETPGEALRAYPFLEKTQQRPKQAASKEIAGSMGKRRHA